MDASAVVAVRMTIRGQVQGVGFRDTMRFEAQRLGVTGWVRNRADGSVEAQAEGTREAVDALLTWARRGPSAARVEAVEAVPAEPTAATRFERRPTG